MCIPFCMKYKTTMTFKYYFSRLIVKASIDCALERILPEKYQNLAKKRKAGAPTLPGSHGCRKFAHVVLIMQGFVMYWTEIKCIVFYKY